MSQSRLLEFLIQSFKHHNLWYHSVLCQIQLWLYHPSHRTQVALGSASDLWICAYVCPSVQDYFADLTDVTLAIPKNNFEGSLP